jgi:hypothetical protein
MHTPSIGRPALVLSIALVAACTPRSNPPASATPNLTSMTLAGVNPGRNSFELRHESSVGERTVSATMAQVWAVLPAVFAQLEIETTRIDSGEGVMGNPGYRARRVEGQRLSRFLDCGRSFGREYADQYSITLGVLVYLVPSPDGGTVVRTVLDAYARDPSQSGTAVHCITWGLLERRVGELVAERLAP